LRRPPGGLYETCSRSPLLLCSRAHRVKSATRVDWAVSRRPFRLQAIPNRLDLSCPSSLPCSTHCGSWFVHARRCTWRSLRFGTNWSLRIVLVAYGFGSLLLIVFCGHGYRSDGTAGARLSASCSQPPSWLGIGVGFVCSGPGRADIARDVRECQPTSAR
jgi:hypothetical protein